MSLQEGHLKKIFRNPLNLFIVTDAFDENKFPCSGGTGMG